MWILIMITITLHFLFDWVLQPRYIAKSKKTNSDSLFHHMVFNILPFTFILGISLVAFFDYEPLNAFFIVGINFISHYLIDMFLPSGKNEREMIDWTAIDQILHINILILLLQL